VRMIVFLSCCRAPSWIAGYQMTLAVDGTDGHFTMLWNRSAVTLPPR